MKSNDIVRLGRALARDREAAIMETLGSIHRAGADIVLTYWALEAATLLA